MSLFDELRPWIRRCIELYQTWINGVAFPEGAETPGALLRFLDSVGGQLLQAGLFVGLAFKQPPLAGVLVLLIAAVFFLSRHSAAIELDLGKRLFPTEKQPDKWSGKWDAARITLSVFAFFAAYLTLPFVAGNIRLVSCILLVIACIDFNTRRDINIKIDQYSREDQLAPQPDDNDYTIINARRSEIKDYLHGKPHLAKEAARVAGCALAFGIAVLGHWSGKAWSAPVAYLCLITTLLVNEIVTWQWRAERDRKLKALEGIQSKELLPFSAWAWIASVAFVVVSGLVAWSEGTITAPAVTIGFANHGGMWGDLLILPLVNGIIAHRLPRLTRRRAVALGALFLAGAILTILAHQQWASIGRASGTTDHVFPTHGTGSWYHDLSGAGYMHMVYMSLELTLLGAYAIVRMPRSTVVLVTFLLTVHVIVGQMQPAWYTTGIYTATNTVIPTLASVFLVWLVACVKLRRAGDLA